MVLGAVASCSDAQEHYESGDSGFALLDGGAHGLDAATGALMDAGLRVADLAPAVLVGNQFHFTEGPVWDPKNNVLYFTDIGGLDSVDGGIAGGVVYRLTPAQTFDVVLQPAGNADGLALDPAGNLLGAGFAARSVWRLSATHALQILGPCADATGSCFSGQTLNTPDDLTVRTDGTIYFTDPTFASGNWGFPTLTLPLSAAQGVYRITTDGVLHLEDSTQDGPNGVNLSPDEKTLYVSYTETNVVAKFDVAPDGSLHNKAVFIAKAGYIADSMCVDNAGNLYVGIASGLAVYGPDGVSLGTISVAGLIVSNCAFGGADQRTLYVTTRTIDTFKGPPPLGAGGLYKIPNMPVRGIPNQN